MSKRLETFSSLLEGSLTTKFKYDIGTESTINRIADVSHNIVSVVCHLYKQPDSFVLFVLNEAAREVAEVRNYLIHNQIDGLPYPEAQDTTDFIKVLRETTKIQTIDTARILLLDAVQQLTFALRSLVLGEAAEVQSRLDHALLLLIKVWVSIDRRIEMELW